MFAVNGSVRSVVGQPAAARVTCTRRDAETYTEFAVLLNLGNLDLKLLLDLIHVHDAVLC